MQKELRDGLILRSLSEGYETDRENIGGFYERVFGEQGDEDTDVLGDWTQDLIDDTHPTTTLDDIWVVVDPAEGDKIVSALLLIPQTWRYEDIEFSVGRIELVATDSAYRRRGLVRALMHEAHTRSETLGHMMQSITGIPFYYRRFGYAMAVELGSRSTLPLSGIPKRKAETEPDYTLRPATVDDVEQLAAWDAHYAEHVLLSTVRTPEMWHYELEGRREDVPFHMRVYIITRAGGEDVGYVAFHMPGRRPALNILSYIVDDSSSYLATMDDVLRRIQQIATEFYEGHEKGQLQNIYFDAGLPPVVDTMLRRMSPARVAENTYAWYTRISDLPRFIRAIAPVLERRLAGSGANRYTGELKIGFYDLTGLTLKFENGHLEDVQHSELEWEKADANYPYHYFHNILFGHFSPQDIHRIFPDAYAKRDALVLLDALFAQRRSWLMALA